MCVYHKGMLNLTNIPLNELTCEGCIISLGWGYDMCHQFLQYCVLLMMLVLIVKHENVTFYLI